MNEALANEKKGVRVFCPDLGYCHRGEIRISSSIFSLALWTVRMATLDQFAWSVPSHSDACLFYQTKPKPLGVVSEVEAADILTSFPETH